MLDSRVFTPRMANAVLWAIFAFVLVSCQGLELTINRKTHDSPGSRARATCGVLVCVEHSHTGVNRNKTALYSDGGSDQVAEISRLEVFRLKNTASDTKRRSLLASISPVHKRLNRVSNGMKVDGRLEDGQALLKVELSKETDCRAEFVCQVQGVDAADRQVVRSMHLKQFEIADEDNQGAGGRSYRDSGLSLQVLTMVQELNAKLTAVNNIVGSWGQEMSHLRETVQRDMQSLKNDVDSTSVRLEDKIDANFKRLEDKLESLDRNVDAKTDRLEDKIESMKDRLEDSIQYVANTASREETQELSSCQNNMSDALGRQIKSSISQLEKKVLTIKGDLVKIGTTIDASIDENFVKIHQQLRAGVESNKTTVYENVSTVSSEPSCEKIKDLSNKVSDGFASLSNSIQENFSNLSSSLKSSTTDVKSDMSGQVSPDGLNSNRRLIYTLATSLSPQTCYKGMSAYVPSIANTYTVIDPTSRNGLNKPVVCDMRTDGGGWVVMQRRAIGDVDFYKGWDAYKHGFGSLYGDFWLGNDLIHNFTKKGKFELRIDMKYNGKSGFAQYGGFSIADETGKYAIQVSGFGGTAGDSLTDPHNGAPFTTHDRDNDAWSSNCAVSYTGAWWYKACHSSNLNGQWAVGDNKGPRWNSFTGVNPVTFSEMKIRKVVGQTV
ncbi:hypothetical protein EGW08_000930 [Elysia chlorotica]|uniref:Fibrinogen C-terminal domain-containing protein n=1 Tax=Elysia chlorotica TaxID=188477 RepID=A0A3S1CFI6_ELYCH|nr:hypothetical protein EGW08_000930 [Elysia chlorotica]